MERERAHWEKGREEWVRENRREEEEGEGRRKVGQIVGNEWSQDEQSEPGGITAVCAPKMAKPRSPKTFTVMFRACLPSPYVWLKFQKDSKAGNKLDYHMCLFWAMAPWICNTRD